MTSDANAEAERIVGRVDRGPMISDIGGSYKEHREAVVAALAAAIKWHEGECWNCSLDIGIPASTCELGKALSALKEL